MVVSAAVINWSIIGHLNGTKTISYNPCEATLTECPGHTETIPVDKLNGHRVQIAIGATALFVLSTLAFSVSLRKPRWR